ncbi:MAG: hypothetical protein ACFCVE_15580 [Phycisphaerae bacterium]
MSPPFGTTILHNDLVFTFTAVWVKPVPPGPLSEDDWLLAGEITQPMLDAFGGAIVLEQTEVVTLQAAYLSASAQAHATVGRTILEITASFVDATAPNHDIDGNGQVSLSDVAAWLRTL